MSRLYYCHAPRRRDEVLARKTLNGIDYLEVASTDQTLLDVFFVHPLPGQPNEIPAPPNTAAALTADNFVIRGGARIRDPRIESVVSTAGNRLRLKVRERGDFSTYTLHLVTSPTQTAVPAGFDPQMAAVDFSFKVLCPSEFDCAQPAVCPPAPATNPPLNYLAKDYASFRRLMLDRLSVLMPDWQERHAPDLGIALVELLAYVGDHLSYYQDAIATEAYLGTARRRVSVRRHARLLDYRMHDGCNARTWVAFTLPPGGGLAEGKVLPAGTPVCTAGHDRSTVIPSPQAFAGALAENPVVFETCRPITLRAAQNTIHFHTWSDERCCLPKGATQATLLNDPPLRLQIGDVLVFEEVLSPTTGTEADADPLRRHAVRLVAVSDADALAQPLTDPLTGAQIVEVAWHTGDALPFPLCLSALLYDASGKPVLREVSVARGNVVLADHGLTLAPSALPSPMDDERYRPELPHGGLTVSGPIRWADPHAASATSLLQQDPRAALPSIALRDDHEAWTPQRDLLGSDRFAPDVVVETEEDGRAYLRFGDDVLGRQPEPGTRFTVACRVGNGVEGNVGAEALTRVHCLFPDLVQVRNPLPARGGAAPETLLQVRQFAPQAFRTQERAVTEADYAAAAERHPEVRRATARFRWTGSWHTVFVTLDRAEGRPVGEDLTFQASIRRHLERFRMAGYDLEIQGPVLVPLEIAFTVCVKPGYFRAAVKEALLEEFSNRDLPDGRRGLFHPDNLTFGQAVFVSQLCERALRVAGVAVATVTALQRQGLPADGELASGRLEPGDLEILRLDNDRNFPENGRITFDLHGGL